MGLNNIVKDSWDYISGVATNVAKNFTVENLQTGYETYIKRSPEELAEVARNAMLRKNTVQSNLNMSAMDDYFAKADKTNEEFVNNFNRMKNNLEAGNISKARTIAERFEDKKYLEYLQEAEKTNTIKERLESMDAATVKRVAMGETKEKIANNKILNNFIDDGEWLADKAYKLSPNNIPAYFTTADKKKNRIRTGVVAGGYMGGAMIVRGIQGGNPITNEYGERDIAGIPLI